jgi:CubicO group peptidase (beta-lactamase class C family)
MNSPRPRTRLAFKAGIFLWSLGCIVATTVPALAAADFSPLPPLIERELKRNAVPGCAVAVVVEGETAFVGGFGTTCIEEGRPVTADTLFRIGSTTKMFTAAAVALLADEGKLDLHQPVGTSVTNLHSALARVTPHQLLTHTAGFNDPSWFEGPHDDDALGIGMRRRDGRLAFLEPGELYSYSNAGYWLAGLLAEEVARRPYADVIRDRLLRPAGMVRSTFRPTEAMTWPFAVGHGPEDRTAAKVIRPLSDNAAVWPAGQLFTTANEFARWCRMFMNGGELDGAHVLPESVVRLMSQPHVAVPGDDRHYGYGLSVGTRDGLTWLSHSGSRLGYGSVARMCLEKKFAVIILCNKTGMNLPRVADAAVKLALGIEPEAAAKNDPQPMTASDLERVAGTYSSGTTTIELVVRDGKLTDKRGPEVTPVGEDRFLRKKSGALAELGFQLSGDADGKPRYLLTRGRALKRQEPDR